jgi:hypothetical protein
MLERCFFGVVGAELGAEALPAARAPQLGAAFDEVERVAAERAGARRIGFELTGRDQHVRLANKTEPDDTQPDSTWLHDS